MMATPTDVTMFDTNVLVYCFDQHDPTKQARALHLISTAVRDRTAVLSAQVLNELYARLVNKKKGVLMPPADAMRIIRRLARRARVLDLTAGTTLSALWAVENHQLSFWDALIWATAKGAGVPTIYTEDLQHGRDLEGVRLVNPFLPPLNPRERLADKAPSVR